MTDDNATTPRRDTDRTGQRWFPEVAEAKNKEAEIAGALFDYLTRTDAEPRYPDHQG